MICPKCKNLLTKVVQNGKLEYSCLSCKSKYDTTNSDSLVYNKDNESFQNVKNGRIIYNYPCNKKVFVSCPSCKSKITAVDEMSKEKIYGCDCGFSWTLTNKT